MSRAHRGTGAAAGRPRLCRALALGVCFGVLSVAVSVIAWPHTSGRSGVEPRATFIPLGALALAAIGIAFLASSRHQASLAGRRGVWWLCFSLVAGAALVAMAMLGATADDPDGSR